MNECLTTPQHINKAAIGCQTNGIEREKAKKKDKMKNKINILAYKIADNKIFGIHYSSCYRKRKRESKKERGQERDKASKRENIKKKTKEKRLKENERKKIYCL